MAGKTYLDLPGLSRSYKVQRNSSILFLIATMSFALNHTTRVAGFNLSLADLLLVVLVLLLVLSSQIFVLRYSFIFFVTVLSSAIATSLWLTPLIFKVNPVFELVLGDVIKLFICFIYFGVGVSVARLGLQQIVMRWFSIGAACVALFGVGLELVGAPFFRETLYYADIRFRGLMTDPNFYAILACAAIAYFGLIEVKISIVKWILIASLAGSIILSGSKTGLLAMIFIAILIIFSRAKVTRRYGAVALFTFLSMLFLLYADRIRAYLYEVVNKLSDSFPQLDRVAVLLSNNPLESISGDGSARDSVWAVGIEFISSSPIFGVGIGNYLNVSTQIFGQYGLAHNTYLQLAVEWGLPLAVLLFGWILYLLLIPILKNKNKCAVSSVWVLRAMIVVFMIGSVSLSLNNARMFWLFLGMLAFLIYENKKNPIPNKVSKINI